MYTHWYHTIISSCVLFEHMGQGEHNSESSYKIITALLSGCIVTVFLLEALTGFSVSFGQIKRMIIEAISICLLTNVIGNVQALTYLSLLSIVI